MTNPKGTRAETALVIYARDNGFGHADRIPRKGKNDEGDVWLCPGVMVEVKNQPSKYNPNAVPYAWLEEAYVERERARADYGLLVVKPTNIGYPRVGEWHCWMRTLDLSWLLVGTGAVTSLVSMPIRLQVRDAVTLLRMAGYGDKL